MILGIELGGLHVSNGGVYDIFNAHVSSNGDLRVVVDKASQVVFCNDVAAPAAVFGNSDRLIQVFVNVLRNSLQALQPGGSVRVKARCYSREGQNWVAATVEDDGVSLAAEVSTNGQTGVEMEALTAVSIAALTVYDMCKALEKGMTVTEIRLESKTGGKSGDYQRG